MNIKSGLLYSKSHEWVEIADGKAKIGLSDYAQSELGDLVYINLPEAGTELAAGDTLCDVESVKAVSDVYSPLAGTISAVNSDLEDNPAALNEDCYGAWICELADLGETSHLMEAAAYEAFIKEG